MNLNPEGVAKAVYVGFLLILWAVLIRLGINDAGLIDFIKALIGVVVGWHGINEWGGYRRAAAPLGDPPAPRSVVTNSFTVPAGLHRADIPAPPPDANP